MEMLQGIFDNVHRGSAWGPFALNSLLSIVILAVIGGFIYLAWQHTSTMKQFIVSCGFSAMMALGAWYFIDPLSFNAVWYKCVYAHLGQMVFLGFGSLFGSMSWRYIFGKRAKLNLAFMHGLAALISIAGGLVLVGELNKLRTFELHPFENTDNLKEIEVDQVSWLPPEVAFKAIDGNFNSSQVRVLDHYLEGIPYKGGLGYSVPTSPEGLRMTYLGQGGGYVIYDDRKTADPDHKVRPINDPQAIGVEMEFLDNIWYQLQMHDMSAYYSDYQLLSLDPKNPDKLTPTIAKIEYRYHLKWLIPVAVPEWAGLILVHNKPDGAWEFEDIPVEEVKKDERFKGQPIFPKSLVKLYGDVQIYDKGLIGAWTNREGKVKIPTLPGNHQYPFFVPVTAERSYYLTALEPFGENSGGMIGALYVDTHTGERFRYNTPADVQLAGAATCLELCSNIRGYNWQATYQSGKSDSLGSGATKSGATVAIWPTLLSRKDRAYIMCTITNVNFRGISGKAVIDMRTQEIAHVFSDRETFERWYSGEEVDTSPEGTASQQLGEIERLLQEIMKKVADTKNQFSLEKE